MLNVMAHSFPTLRSSDLVHDEGEAAVELLELLLSGECGLALRLGDIACRLLADGPQQVEILPVQVRHHGRSFQQQKARQPFQVDERHDQPCAAVIQQPFGRTAAKARVFAVFVQRSEEHTSELQSLMRISYAVFCLKKKTLTHNRPLTNNPYV